VSIFNFNVAITGYHGSEFATREFFLLVRTQGRIHVSAITFSSVTLKVKSLQRTNNILKKNGRKKTRIAYTE
jgi:hypothetical protein